MCRLVIVDKYLRLRLGICHVVRAGKCGKPCIVLLTVLIYEILQGFLAVRVRFLCGFVILLCITFSHHPVSLQSVLCHHVIGKRYPCFFVRCQFGHLVQQRLKQ